MTLKSVIGGFEKNPKNKRHYKDTTEINTRGRKLNKVKRDNSSKRFVETPSTSRWEDDDEY